MLEDNETEDDQPACAVACLNKVNKRSLIRRPQPLVQQEHEKEEQVFDDDNYLVSKFNKN